MIGSLKDFLRTKRPQESRASWPSRPASLRSGGAGKQRSCVLGPKLLDVVAERSSEEFRPVLDQDCANTSLPASRSATYSTPTATHESESPFACSSAAATPPPNKT